MLINSHPTESLDCRCITFRYNSPAALQVYSIIRYLFIHAGFVKKLF